MKRETERERVNIKIDNLFYVFVRGERKREVVRVFFFRTIEQDEDPGGSVKAIERK